MVLGVVGYLMFSGGVLNEVLLNQVGFDYFFQGVGVFVECGGQGIQFYWVVVEFVYYYIEQVVVGVVQVMVVYFQYVQGVLCYWVGELVVIFDLGVVVYLVQQLVGDMWCVVGVVGYFLCFFLVVGYGQNVIGVFDDVCQIVDVIEFQLLYDIEMVMQGCGEQVGSGGGVNQGKGWQVQFDGVCCWVFVDYDVELVVFYCWIEYFFYYWGKLVDFVYEQYVFFFEVGEDGGQVIGFFQYWFGGGFKL